MENLLTYNSSNVHCMLHPRMPNTSVLFPAGTRRGIHPADSFATLHQHHEYEQRQDQKLSLFHSEVISSPPLCHDIFCTQYRQLSDKYLFPVCEEHHRNLHWVQNTGNRSCQSSNQWNQRLEAGRNLDHPIPTTSISKVLPEILCHECGDCIVKSQGSHRQNPPTSDAKWFVNISHQDIS